MHETNVDPGRAIRSSGFSVRPHWQPRFLAEPALASKWRLLLLVMFIAALVIRTTFLLIAPNNSTDAWSRYVAAVVWLQHPNQLPRATESDAWLPMHFWLLGVIVWITKSEMAARVLSVLLGSLTVVLLASIAARCFNRRIALGSAVLLAFFGFHIAFSVTTSSEAVTIFLVSLGTYAWIRYAGTGSCFWVLVSAAAFNMAALCRFEPWLCAPTLAFLLLLDESGRWPTGGASRQAWYRAFLFGLLSCAGSVGWIVFSYLRWGDPLKLPHRTMWLNAHFAPYHHSLLFRVVDVPGSLVMSLGPLIAVLALYGTVHVLLRGPRPTRAIAALLFVLFAFNCYNSVRYETTQARYTLLYSWLVFPFALDGLAYVLARVRWAISTQGFVAIVASLCLWQTGIVVGANYAPQPIGDHLGALSPTIPLHAELREVTDWLRANKAQKSAVILDDYNWESGDIFRFANLKATSTFSITQQDYDDPVELKARLQQFVNRNHPELLICSPDGPIGKTWCHPDNRGHLESPNLLLAPRWHGDHWYIYTVSYK